MARRKSVEEESTTIDKNDLIADLIKGTEFEAMSNESVGLTNRPKARTPLDILNAFFGGGLPLGSIIEVFGPNAGGKSTFTYSTVGMFMDDFPDGVVLLLDAEATTDYDRLVALGVKHPERILRLKIKTLEDGFEQITKVLAKLDKPELKDVPIIILWDGLQVMRPHSSVRMSA